MKKSTKSKLRKLEPRAKMPTAAVLQRFSSLDRRLLAKMVSQTLECVYDQSFRRPTAARTLMKPLLNVDEPAPANNDDSGLDLLAPPRHRLLTAAEERQLFLRFNYCRYRVMRMVHEYRGKRLGVQASREALHWARESLRTRNQIVRANTSLVMAMARRTRTTGVELGDLISEGNLALMRCVDKFDCSRGFKFSTYGCRAIMSSFARQGNKSARYRMQFPSSYDASFERSDFLERKRDEDADDCISGLKLVLSRNSAELSQVERRVINARFDLDRTRKKEESNRPRTLEQIGQSLGVSKERVRQIQNRALEKLRNVIEDDVLVAS